MDARTLSIKTIFGQDRRHMVPLFQRPYVWKRDAQWEPLWEDIRSVADRLIAGQAVRPHFLGAIVLDQLRQPYGHVETRLVVDGQQRLTTIQLLLEAFADLCDQAGVEKYHKALRKLTRNDDPLSSDSDEQFKVWPTNVDQPHFRTVMSAKSDAEVRDEYSLGIEKNESGHTIPDAYLFFVGGIRDWLRIGEDGYEARIERLFEAVRDYVRMVVIDLEKEDDAQLIFETMNARGTPLLPSDLVKNFLFHRADIEKADVDSLYRRFWKPLDDENDYWRKEIRAGRIVRPRIDIFLFHYLTLKRRDEVPAAHLYAAFREQGGALAAPSAETQLRELWSYAAIFRSFDALPDDSPKKIFFERLDAMETTTAYPFLIELFKRHGSDEQVLAPILQDVESFLVRRMVCQLTTKNYNRLFLDLLGVLTAEDGDPAPRVRAHLAALEGDSVRWPKYRELRGAWLESPLFRSLVRRRVRMLLEALEGGLRTPKTEKMPIGEKLTVEHLLPQEWITHWPLAGATLEETEKRERMLHTLGNLTLLNKRLNPSASNGPWPTKRAAIKKHSVLLLNRPVVEHETWGEVEIAKRGQVLLDVACRLWPRPGDDVADQRREP